MQVWSTNPTNPNIFSSPGVSTETINKQATTNPPSSDRSRETDQDISSPGRAEGNDGMVMLVRTHPGVFIKSETLQHAVRSAKKSNKSGYTLCYNLLPGVFSIQEIAISRGQGLTKQKEGDLRKVLDKDKVAAIKGYVRR
ncbi:uncharacterized protein LOC134250495 [Saccostrea cucullata]|uniref:uncharacterized protein LOC134250495 n=1 Tax=Saccostrea cuccullata TaxID=36930 RepID=UPI002ED69724